jgi:hypothetical protein
MARRQLGVAASRPDDAATRADLASVKDARLEMYEMNLGDGTQGPFTVPHNKNTRTVLSCEVIKNVGGVSLTAAEQGAVVDCQWKRDPNDPLNKVIVAPDEAWGLNEMRIGLLLAIGGSDVAAPSAPTLTVNSVTDSTITVTAAGATDNVGVTGINWYLNGASITTQAPGQYTFTGLTVQTGYTITATAIDAAGNQSPLAATSPATTTTNGTPVQRRAAGTYGPGSGSQFAWSAASTVNGVQVGDIIIAYGITSHVNGINPSTGFNTLTMTSNLANTTFTKVASIASNSGNNGTMHVFIATAGTAGNHVCTFNSNSTPSGQWQDRNNCVAAAYQGVGSYQIRNTTPTGASGALNAANITSAAGNMVVLGLGTDQSAVGTLTGGTQRVGGGASGNGQIDFLYLIDAPGAAAVTITDTGSRQHTYIAVDLVKAA